MKITVNNKKTFDLEKWHEGLPVLKAQNAEIKLLNKGQNEFLFTCGNKVFKATIKSHNVQKKELEIWVNGVSHTVVIKDRYDELLEQMGLHSKDSMDQAEIKAPMPGLVVDILIDEGQEVEKNQPILVLEAMKMENVLKAPGEGKVKAIQAKQGESVEKNAVLVIFD